MKKAIGIALAWVMAQAASAQVSLPYSIAFETNAAVGETILTNANCGAWEGGPEDVAYVTNLTPPKPSCDYPLPSEDHTNVVFFATLANGAISNSFVPTGFAEGVRTLWIDTMVQPGRMSDPPTGSVTNSTMALYFDTNGFLTVYNGYQTNRSDASSKSETNFWTTLSNSFGPVASWQWVRVTVELKYTDTYGDPGQAYFNIKLNGTAFTSEWAYADADFSAASTGSWFLCANYNNYKLSSMALSGSGMLDDLVVSTNTPVFSEAAPFVKVHIAGQGYMLFGGAYATNNQVLPLPSQGVTTNFYLAATNYHYVGNVWTGAYGSALTGQVAIAEEKPSTYDFAWSNIVSDSDLFVSFAPHVATNGTPLYWMDGKGLGTNETYPTWDDVALWDKDGDGMLTWEEYVAGTHPDNSNSVLRIVGQTFSNGVPRLIWLSSTEALAPYMIQMSTNLISGAWSNVAVNISASGTGTNTQDVAAPAGGQGMYKVTVTN